MNVSLYDHQKEAIENLTSGKILCGGVGSGKSRTALCYYIFRSCGGSLPVNNQGQFRKMKKPKDLYIITTARKRDTFEWEDEMKPLGLSRKSEDSVFGVSCYIDSWNNIEKYKKVRGAFFIFDEQRVVGSGPWVKNFLTITKVNDWILLSATPGDGWLDYIPVFIANGFYKNRTEFMREHVIFSRFAKYPKVDRYVGCKRLIRLRDQVLVTMDFSKPTIQHHERVTCIYDRERYKLVMKTRFDPFKNEPVTDAGVLCYVLRKVVNSSESRLSTIRIILGTRNKAIIFYNFDYELEILRSLSDEYAIAEWNGHKHEPVPKGERWAYLVQYTAGCEGWNCIETDTIIFYSSSYSYKQMVQAAGRIDRLNTPFRDLYYYHLRSSAPIDLAIEKALSEKRNFNEYRYFQQ